MSEQAAQFRESARQCRRLAEARNKADRVTLEETAAELAAEADKIDAERQKPAR